MESGLELTSSDQQLKSAYSIHCSIYSVILLRNKTLFLNEGIAQNL